MADTRGLHEVEKYVRKRLKREFGPTFESQVLTLRTGGTHQFDAVSVDGQVVAGVKSASGLTAGGRIPAGKIKDSIAELYYLSLVDAPTKLLVLTTPSFFDLFTKQMAGRIAPGIEVRLMRLPNQLRLKVADIQVKASTEIRPTRRR